MTAALLALALSFATPAAPAVPAFDLEVDDAQHATGFVALSWKDLETGGVAEGSLLLVTAAHAVYGARTIDVSRIDCHPRSPNGWKTRLWVMDAGTTVLLWPTHDVAAILLRGPGVSPAANAPSVDWDALARSAARLDGSGTLRAFEVLDVVGFHQANYCGRNVAFFLYDPKWAAQAAGLAEQFVRSERARGVRVSQAEALRRVRGSMSDDTPLVQYFSPTTAGASGGAVVLAGEERPVEERPAVIGVHLAGFSGVASSWAVRMGPQGRPLPRAEVAHLGDDPVDWPQCASAPAPPGPRWPCYGRPQFSQSIADVPDDVRAVTVRWARRGVTLSLSAGTDMGSQYAGSRAAPAPIEAIVVGPNWNVKVGAGFDMLRWDWQKMSLGTRAMVGYRSLQFERQLVGPDGLVLDTVEVDKRAFVFEVWPLEWTFNRRSRLWPTVGPGARFTTGEGGLGLLLHGRVAAATLVPRLALTMELSGGIEFSRGLRYRYPLIGGTAAPESTRGPVFGVSLGLEWIPL